MKTYSNPQTVLSETILRSIKIWDQVVELYHALGGEGSCTSPFTIVAEGKAFKNVYAPSIVNCEDSLGVKWGNQTLKQVCEGEKRHIKLPPKWSYDWLTVKHMGYPGTVVGQITAPDFYTYLPITWDKNVPQANRDLDFLMSNLYDNNLSVIGAVAGLLVGTVTKVACLPVGSYDVVDWETRNGTYGTLNYLKVLLKDDIKVIMNKRNDEGEWIPTEVTASKFVWVRCNSGLDRNLKANPVFSEENPGILTVTGHGNFQGKKTCKANLSHNLFNNDNAFSEVDF